MSYREMSLDRLYHLADKERDRQRYKLARAAVIVRKMTRRQVRRAKKRQDEYLILKALAVTVQTICVLLVCLMGLVAFYEIKHDSESAFYSTELLVEIILLFVLFCVVAAESLVLRLILIIAVLLVFLLNVLQIVYFLLFNPHHSTCRRTHLLFGPTVCITTQSPLEHHSTLITAVLAVLHLIHLVFAIGVASLKPRSISDIVERTDARLLQYINKKHSRRRARRSERRSRGSESRRSRSRLHARTSVRSAKQSSRSASRSRRQAEQRPPRSPQALDITKLPDGTRFKTSNSKSFHMEYYVENGVFVGSGTEVINKAISICAPIRAPLQSEESWQRAETPRNPMIINKNRLMQQEARNVE